MKNVEKIYNSRVMMEVTMEISFTPGLVSRCFYEFVETRIDERISFNDSRTADRDDI